MPNLPERHHDQCCGQRSKRRSRIAADLKQALRKARTPPCSKPRDTAAVGVKH
jgi:hypothetical protein